MAEKNCNRFLDYSVKLVSHRRSFSHCFCVLNFAFSLVATLGNLLVIDTVKKLFLSLAFSHLAVGLCSQLITVYNSIWCFKPYNFVPTIRISVCSLTINIESKALVNEPAI